VSLIEETGWQQDGKPKSQGAVTVYKMHDKLTTNVGYADAQAYSIGETPRTDS
jgi:hypothetical protein